MIYIIVGWQAFPTDPGLNSHIPMMNDTSLGTTSMMSTTSQFSSPLESTEISDWSRAEHLTFVPPNNSPNETESFRVNLAKLPEKQVTPTSVQQSQWAANKVQNPKQWPNHSNSRQQSYHQPHLQQLLPQFRPQQQQHQCPPHFHSSLQQFIGQAEQRVPSQSEWMQSILEQNRNDCPTLGGAVNGQNQRDHRGLGGMRSLWEQRIMEQALEKQREEMANARGANRRQFLFPKWRSNDPMSSSLVASSRTVEIIPRDSRIPEHRHERLIQSEQAAQKDKFELHKPYIQMAICRQNQRRGRSLLMFRPPCDAEEMARQRTMALYDEGTGQWYDPNQIRQAVSHESIANVGATRQMWEQSSWHAQAQSQWEREQQRQQHFAAQHQHWQ